MCFDIPEHPETFVVVCYSFAVEGVSRTRVYLSVVCLVNLQSCKKRKELIKSCRCLLTRLLHKSVDILHFKYNVIFFRPLMWCFSPTEKSLLSVTKSYSKHESVVFYLT